MHTAVMAREKLFNMRMSADEWSRLEFLADHYGVNAASVIRMLLKKDETTVLSGGERMLSAIPQLRTHAQNLGADDPALVSLIEEGARTAKAKVDRGERASVSKEIVRAIKRDVERKHPKRK